MPGTYLVDIYLNDSLVDTRDVSFVGVNGKLQPQLTASYLGNIGVKLAAFPPLQQLPVEQPVTDLGRYIPQAGSQFHFTQQRLNLSIPQAALSNEGASAG